MTNPFKNLQAGPYGYGAPTDYGEPHHLGIDWASNFQPLVAPTASKIISTSYGPAGGFTLVFQPLGGTRVIRWLHLDKFYVKPGDVVKEGQIICKSGNSGHRPGVKPNEPGYNYQPHTHDDHWVSLQGSRTLNFKYTLNPQEYYERNSMVVYQNKGTLYFPAGDTLIGYATDFATFQSEFPGAVMVELPDSEFAKFKMSSLVIKK